MPEHIRALAVILLLATCIFFFAKKITEPLIAPERFIRWRNTWFAITIIAFFSGHFWVYVLLSALLLLQVGKHEQNKFGLFLVLLFAIPGITADIPGFGLANYLFKVDYIRILSFAILLPAYLSLRKEPETIPFFRLWSDKLLFGYLLLSTLLLFRDLTAMEAIRGGLYNFTDAFLPYYVASRGIKNLKQLQEVIIAFVIAGFIVAPIAIFEYVKFWLLYANLSWALGVNWEMGGYLGRGDNIRAMASFGVAIPLGYAMMMTLGCYLFLAQKIESKLYRYGAFAIIIGGLFAPLSRGPWVGAAVLIVFFIALSPYALKRLGMMAIAVILIIPTLGSIPAGQKIINMLPFIGTTSETTVDYRVKLLDNAFIVFEHHPFFGASSYRDDLAELGMVQGEGIVDIVNTYLELILERGLVGLTLFLGFFYLILHSIFLNLRRLPNNTHDFHLIGRVLLSCLIATLVTITTTSSILSVPIIYWSFAGIGVSYIRLVKDYLRNLPEAPILPTYRIIKAITT